MLTGDLLLVGPDERTATDDILASDDQAVNPVRTAQDEVRDEPDTAAGVEQLANRRNSRPEPEVRGRAVRDADAPFRERPYIGVREMHAVRAPDVVGRPADALEVLERRTT